MSCAYGLDDLPEANTEGQALFEVPELPEENQDFVGSTSGKLDLAAGVRGCDSLRSNTPEQEAVELATVFGAVSVNPAAAAIEGSARLGEMRSAEFGLRSKQQQAEGSQFDGVIAWLELNVGKDHAVATQAAFEAKALGCGGVRAIRIVQGKKDTRTTALRQFGGCKD